jgi:isopentenyl-diphosphate delta-isomerase
MEQQEEQVTLVDRDDRELGVEGKLAAHQSGKLHRAFSIFLFDAQGRVLLQQRALVKYHSGGLWSNTCCSHPRPGEDSLAAARRRLVEEMGIDCALTQKFSFIYRAVLPNGLIEHEYLHVFFGRYDGEPTPNPDEVEAWKWVDLHELSADVRNNPDAYSFWLAACLDEVVRQRQAQQNKT